jgi:glycosyltransferase involved in cell wall biosynthesis
VEAWPIPTSTLHETESRARRRVAGDAEPSRKDHWFMSILAPRGRRRPQEPASPDVERDAPTRVLWLVPYNPWPPHHGGKLRVWGLVTGMAGDDVRITVSYPENGAGSPPPAVPNVTWLPYRSRSRSGLSNKLLSTVSRYPEAAWEPANRQHSALIKACAREFDVVILEQGHMASFRSAVAEIPTRVVVAQNVEHVLLRQVAGTLPRLRARLRYRLDALKYRLLEARVFGWADLVVAVSDVDADKIRSLSSTPVVVRPNGVDLERFAYADPTDALAMDVVLVGTLGYLPNLDAGRWIATDIWPRIRAQVPDANFYLVGAHCPPALAAMHDPDNGFHVVGFVDDVIPYFHRGRAFLMPLRMGSGTRLKAVQAMAAGCPMVSTTQGVEGLGVDNGMVAVGDDPDELADATVALLLDEELRLNQARRAVDYVAENFSWKKIAADLRDDIRPSVS